MSGHVHSVPAGDERHPYAYMHPGGLICVPCDGCFGWLHEGEGIDDDAVCMLEHDRWFQHAPERSTIADEAQSAVYGDRGKDYGHPRENFTDTAALWSALLADRLSAPITPEDVARCMIAVKLARDLHSPKRDNRVDIVGYAITLDRLETGL